MRKSLKQNQRAIALLIDVLILMFVSRLTFGGIFPPLGEKGFWFYTALLSVLVGTKLVTPFYVKPVDAIAYSVPAFVALMLANKWSEWAPAARAAYAVALTLAVLTGVCAFMALILNNVGVKKLQDISNRLRLLVEGLASPQVIYSPIMIFAMIAFHYKSPKELVSVAIAMLLTTTLSVGDLLLRGSVRFKQAVIGSDPIECFGLVTAYQKPGIYLLRTENLNEENLPTPILINDELTGLRFAYAMDTVGRENGHLCRAVELGAIEANVFPEIAKDISPNMSIKMDADVLIETNPLTSKLCHQASSIIGLVAADTTVNRLFFEITRNEGLSVGRLVSVEFCGKKVLYQIIAGLTREETVINKNTYGYLRAQAQQIGIWQKDRFVHCNWLPEMNLPVKLEEEQTYSMRPRTIGRFPQTNYTAEIENIHQLVTHNTAILGILGVGKSMLAIELVERMITEGIKVICLDLTNQYASELEAFYHKGSEEESLKGIQEACQQDRDCWSENPEEGGSLENLRIAIQKDLLCFLSAENPKLLKIYNPSCFDATRQENEPRSFKEGEIWQRGAGLYSVTSVEATQIITETALACVSDRMSDEARVCLVYEEAHALVPEWNSVVVEGDKRATSGTARAILQGRKYGLGCLLVTQRTANVTKTILNQCNSIFAMRTFDETGKEFLSNYLGKDYSDELSSLPERHAVFFGRASNCENPVLIELNDRDQFRKVFRSKYPPPEKDLFCEVKQAETEKLKEFDFDLDDEVPF